MPGMKKDLHPLSLDECFASLKEPKNQPSIRAPKPKLTEDEQKPTEEEVISKYAKLYGSPGTYKVLILDSKASLTDIISVFKNLCSSLESRIFNKAGILVVENDSVIERYQSELRSLKVQLPSDWKAQGSDYRIILKAAKTYGVTYQMTKDKSGWTYKQVKEK